MKNEILKLTAYVGTYTYGDSKGIYKFAIDSVSGIIDDVTLAATIDSPTYISIDKDNKHLYSVIREADKGGIAAFSMNIEKAELELLNYKVSQGKPPCHVNLDNESYFVFYGNYHESTIEVFDLNSDGSIHSSLSRIKHEGSSLNKERQEKAHVHCVTLTPDEKYLCAIDLGMDKLEIYNFNKGILSKTNDSSLLLTPGCGPRHIEFHPNNKFAYIITELSSEIIVLEYSSSNGRFKELQYISTHSKEYTSERAGGAIHISKDGNYLYASNRGDNTIAVFSIDITSGKLNLISHTSTQGEHPRDFAIDPTGNLLIVANQHSNNIVPFSIDKSTGTLTQISSPVYVPNAVCIKFINV